MSTSRSLRQPSAARAKSVKSRSDLQIASWVLLLEDGSAHMHASRERLRLACTRRRRGRALADGLGLGADRPRRTGIESQAATRRTEQLFEAKSDEPCGGNKRRWTTNGHIHRHSLTTAGLQNLLTRWLHLLTDSYPSTKQNQMDCHLSGTRTPQADLHASRR